MKIQHLKIFAVVFMLLFLTVASEGSQKNTSPQRDESMRRGERRATLEPNLFKDPRVRRAYQAAKEIPWILDSIYCYCRCAESPVFRHKSLLSCYVDDHASM